MRIQQTWKLLLTTTILAGLAVVFAGGVARGAPAVVEHTELALLIDGSGSISLLDFALQKSGYVSALDAELPTDGTISVGVWLFATSVDQVFPLTAIDSEAAKTSLLDAIEGMEPPRTNTSIGGAILAATEAFADAGHLNSGSTMQIIDVSTDAGSTDDADAAADHAVATGVEQINALLVGHATAATFIRGTDAYYTSVASWTDFEQALRVKLAREVAWLGLPMPPPPPPPPPPNHPPVVTLPGEISFAGSQQGSASLTATVIDPDGDTMKCLWGWWDPYVGTSVSWLSVTTVDGEGSVTLDLGDMEPLVLRGRYDFVFFATDQELPLLEDLRVPGNVHVWLVDSPTAIVLNPGGTYLCTEDQRILVGGGSASDWDGDGFYYILVGYGGLQWLQTVWGGEPVAIPPIDVGSAADLGCGTHTFRWISYDYYSWAATVHELEVTIVPPDTTEPTITSAIASPAILWPPNHKMVDVIVEVDASDDRDEELDLTVEVSCNEPVEGAGDGTSRPDYEIVSIDLETGIIHLQLRAERSGLGDVRTYTIHVTATDDAGNASATALDVVVPHN